MEIKKKKKKKKKETYDVFGEKAVTARTWQIWLEKFCFGDFSLKDEPRSRRSSNISDDVLRSVIRTNPTLTSTELVFNLGIHQTTALDYIKRFGFVSKLSGCHTN
ncbi:histone-lysine N-methyltransferase SETMAR [Trichonephila clavipes]|nr:histone-lysine N-methyltransferase SETMAR [Trichonephila clavipes]